MAASGRKSKGSSQWATQIMVTIDQIDFILLQRGNTEFFMSLVEWIDKRWIIQGGSVLLENTYMQKVRHFWKNQINR